jgi:hypothetical protein
VRARLGILALALILVLPTGCASSSAPGSGLFSTPEKAEEALFVATKAYETVVIVVNHLHLEKKISPEQYALLVGSPNSVANQARTAGLEAHDAIQRWRKRETDASEFARHYTLMTSLVSHIDREVKR